MKRISPISFLFLTTISCFCSETFIGPTARVKHDSEGHGIYSNVMEISPWHHRFLNTYTAFIPPDYTSAVKWSADFLLQRLNYKKLTNNHNYLTPQLTTAISLNKILANRFLDSCKLDIYASYSWGKLLKAEGIYFTPFSGWGIQGGIEKRVPFFHTNIGRCVIYDVGKHHLKYGKDKLFKGAGMSVFVEQPIGENVSIRKDFIWRAPFNHYGLQLQWKPNPKHGFGVFGNRTVGKITNEKLSSKNVGIEWILRIPPMKKKNKLFYQKCAGNVPEKLKKWAKDSETFYPQVQPRVETIPEKPVLQIENIASCYDEIFTLEKPSYGKLCIRNNSFEDVEIQDFFLVNSRNQTFYPLHKFKGFHIPPRLC